MPRKKHWLMKKKVLVAGLGLHGGGRDVVRYLISRGAQVRVTDAKKRSELKSTLLALPKIQGTFGRHLESDADWADIIIKNPGIPKDNPLIMYARKKANKKVLSDLDLFFRETKKKPDVAVTGTRGKSTTAALCAHIIKSKKKVYLAGNIRRSVLEDVEKARKSFTVFELSSWQIEDCEDKRISPKIGIFTTLFTDHLNRYKHFSDYQKAKERLFLHQSRQDAVILNFDQLKIRGLEKKLQSKVFFISMRKLSGRHNGVFCDKDKIFWLHNNKRKFLCSSKDIPLLGKHNIHNALFAIQASLLAKISPETIVKSLKTFKGLEGRLEYLGKRNGAYVYNDTAATTPDALAACVTTLSKKYPKSIIHVLCGGTDKKLDFSVLKKIKKIENTRYYFLGGTATKKIRIALGIRSAGKIFTNMQEPVRFILQQAHQEDVIVLSPGAASFGLFKHEFDRGSQFENVIQAR